MAVRITINPIAIASNRALLWAALISGGVATAAGAYAAYRVLRPLDQVRWVVRRLARDRRVPLGPDITVPA